MHEKEAVLALQPTEQMAFDFLAEKCGLTPQELFEQSIKLGLSCAEVIIENEATGSPTYLLYEVEPDVYEKDAEPFSFSIQSQPRTIVNDMDVEDPFAEDALTVWNIGPEVMKQLSPVLEQLDVSLENFMTNAIHLCVLFYDYKADDQKILITVGDKYFVLGHVE
jgi:hypothetical protein